MEVSSLHNSVLGSIVPGVTSVTNASSTISNSSINSYSSSFDSVSFSSTGQMMAAEGNHPPDFDSMSTEEFMEHLVELQAAMEEQGIDISNMVDPTTLSDDELNALKDEMSAMGSKGKHGPPPSAYDVSEEVDTIDLLMQALEVKDEVITSLFEALA